MTNQISPNTTIAQYTIVSKIGEGDRQMMATTVKTDGPQFEKTTPVALFKTRTIFTYGLFREFDVTSDRQRFLIGTLVGDSKPTPPTVIMNWTALLKK